MGGALKLFLFDLDGTLIDSKRDIAASVHHTMSILGLPPIPDETIYAFVGHGVTPLIRQSVGAGVNVDFDRALDIFRKHYDVHCLDTTQLFDGMAEILNQFRDKKMAVITNKSQGFSEKIIKGLGLSRYFFAVQGGDTAFPKKPDPAVVHHLLKEAGVAASETVLIGDSAVDIETGKKAGVKTCGVTWGFRPKEEVQGGQPDWIAAAPSDLKKFL